MTDKPTVSGQRKSTGLLWASILGILLIVITVFAGDYWRRHRQKRQWVSEAQAAVEYLLQTADRIPASMKERLGPFRGLSGQRIGGAAWNTQGYEYLVADRDAHFANVTVPVRIYVIEGRRTNPSSQEIVVQSVQRDQSLYLIDATLPQEPTEGLRIMVSHPLLKRL
jgi:hypothetical protein